MKFIKYSRSTTVNAVCAGVMELLVASDQRLDYCLCGKGKIHKESFSLFFLLKIQNQKYPLAYIQMVHGFELTHTHPNSHGCCVS